MRRYYSPDRITRHEQFRERFGPKGSLRHRLACWVTEPIYIQLAGLQLARIYTDLLTSTLSDVYWVFFSAIWGTIKLFHIKNSAYVEEDNSWTFGQILPAFLLLAPLISVSECFAESRHDKVPGQSPGLEHGWPEFASDDDGNDSNTNNNNNAADGFTRFFSQSNGNKRQTSSLH
ncbi:hypothetical protein VTJ04DRAFT_3206 [Mycothermus thermophilus]|uniref:uncharacterized protein n=1 Tax=Humicola insolens TaxID=85995 RepID=UPI003742E1B2